MRRTQLLALIAGSITLAACAGMSLTPEDHGRSLEISSQFDPMVFASPEGITTDEDKAIGGKLAKLIREEHVDVSGVFAAAVSEELKSAGLFTKIVEKDGGLKLTFTNFGVHYSDGDMTKTAPVFMEGVVGVKILRLDGSLAWMGNIYASGRDGGKRVDLEELVGSSKALTDLVSEYGHLYGKVLAGKLKPAQ